MPDADTAKKAPRLLRPPVTVTWEVLTLARFVVPVLLVTLLVARFDGGAFVAEELARAIFPWIAPVNLFFVHVPVAVRYPRTRSL